MKRLWIALLLLSQHLSAHVLFYLQDAGETYGLLPVIQQLPSCEIVAGGTAAEILKNKVPFIPLDVDKAWPRDKLLPEETINALLERNPSVVVTGVAFAAQGQVLKAFRAKGVPGYAFWDNLNDSGADAYFSTAQSVAEQAPAVLVPSEDFPFGIPVGQPALENGAWQIEGLSRDEIRNRLGIRLEETVFVFFGGYGKAYEEGFQLLRDCMRGRSEKLFVQIHPKADGALERKAGLRILPKEISSLEAMAMADVVLCHQSSASFQALAAGIPVIYLIPQNQLYDNRALQAGLAAKVSCPEEFSEFIPLPFSFFETLHIPLLSVERIIETISRQTE